MRKMYDINVVADALTRYLISVLPRVENILDIGAGNCRFLELYPYKDPTINITFIDKINSDGDEFKIAKENLEKYDNLTFIETGAEDLSMIEDKKFDMIMFSHVYEHLTDDEQEKALAHMSRVIKDNGFLVFTCPNRIGRKNIGKYMAHPGHIEEPTYSEILEKLEKNDFSVINNNRGIILIQKDGDHSAKVSPIIHDDTENSYAHWLICVKKKRTE